MNDSVTIRTNESARKKFMTGVYSWMVLALAISAACAYVTATNTVLLSFIFGNAFVFPILVLGELALVFWLSARIGKMSAGAAAAAFVAYSVLNGITLSSVVLVYSGASIVRVFLITAGMFACMSVYGRVTKSDLRSAGRYLMMAVFGILIASVVNVFTRSSGLDWILSLVTVGVFTGLTAYDTQKLYRISAQADESELFAKVAIIGALELYLDFVNVFLALLRLFGKSKN
ncbi:Bax inhibitor-1/YccA family protein [Treponema brennaborense]|uniref:Integral membrane protein n=1 Tax=Treponema brennaborense (strain DSM 12168 / CIP 105900 / DD5/3) TaxID=906968 RepID=F4LJA7_TREBD|nr:Bax inhibitor-1/YccA family protein [Treponema brennaborense]AEE17352.1 protein of unknown function UPF0005 [Treponema brennaborense DSM 12168]